MSPSNKIFVPKGVVIDINKINSKSVLNLYIIGDFFCKNRFFFFSFFKTLNIFMDSDLKQGLGGYL